MERLTDDAPLQARRLLATDAELDGLMILYPERRHATTFEATLSVVADPVRARFSAWYELFPRSVRGDGTHGTLADVQAKLPEIAALGTRERPSAPAAVGGGGVTLFRPDGNLRALEEIEADVIRLAIGHYRGRMTEVARRLGIGRSTLYRKLGELGIDNAA